MDYSAIIRHRHKSQKRSLQRQCLFPQILEHTILLKIARVKMSRSCTTWTDFMAWHFSKSSHDSGDELFVSVRTDRYQHLKI